MTELSTVTVSRVKFNGEALDGEYPIVRIDETNVVIRHPVHGAIRVLKANTNLPSSSPVTLSYDDILADIRSRFDTLSRIMDGIVRGNIRSVIVSGAPGVGKSHSIEQKLEAAKAAGKIKSYNIVRGTVSPLGLYVLLWENRESGQIIVIDDSDDIFRDETGTSLMKSATDSGKKRRVSYLKELAMFDAKGIPNNFVYEGSIVVATNIDFEREIAIKTKTAVHLSAVLNRAIYVDLGLHSKQALMARVEDVIRTTPMLSDEGLDTAQTEAVLLWLKENQSSVRSLSLRTAMILAGMVKTEPTTWKLTAKTTLLKAVAR